MMNLARFRPKIVNAAKGYNSQTFISDLSSGITVGVIALLWPLHSQLLPD
jgi:hypothetical protein